MKLPHSVNIQYNDGGDDGQGGVSVEWEDLSENMLPAHVIPLAGRRRFFAQAIQSVITHKVVMRFRSDVKPEMSVVYKGKRYIIYSIVDVSTGASDQQYMSLDCEEVV
jgi:SPP1 family predicted phage head-tail adaptor